MPALPGSIALTSIADGSNIVAADHRNNYTAIQTAINALIADLSGGTAGALLQATSASAIGFLPDAPIDKNALVWDAATGRWKPQGGALYRKTTAKTVNNSIVETDLLNGEITVGANVLGASGLLRLTAEGDLLQNAVGPIAAPRFKLKLGATTLLDTNTIAASIAQSASRFSWKIVCEIANLGATNSQWASIVGQYTAGGATTGSLFTTGEGSYLVQLVTGGVAIANMVGGNSGALDTTAAQALVLSVILGTASASHEIVLKRALVEIL